MAENPYDNSNPIDDDQTASRLPKPGAVTNADYIKKALNGSGSNSTPSNQAAPGSKSGGADAFSKDGGPVNASKLKEKEEGPDRSGNSALDDIRERLGHGYTGKGSTKSKGLSNLFNSKSMLKKKFAIAAAAAGGSAAIAALLFLLMLPLKIETLLQSIRNDVGATTTSALEHEVESEYSTIMAKHILPNLGRGACRSTVDISCVSVPAGSSPFTKFLAAFKQSHAEQKLAGLDNGFLVGIKGGLLYMKVNGVDYSDPETMNRELREVEAGRRSFFDVGGKQRASRQAIRRQLESALSGVTRWKRVYYRFKFGKLLEKKYGVKRCIMLCTAWWQQGKDKLADTIQVKQAAAKLFLAQRVVGPFAGNYGLLMQCVISPDQCDTKLHPDPEGGRENSDLNSKLETALDAYIAEHGSEKLADLVERAGDLRQLGVGGYALKLVTEKLAEAVGGDAAKIAAGQAVKDSVPIAGQFLALINVLEDEQKIPEVSKAIAYASRAAAAIQTNEMFWSIVSEIHAGGGLDSTIVGGFDGLTSLNGVDATATPLYGHVAQDSGALVGADASIFGSLFGASVAGGSGQLAPYTCNDNKPLAQNATVCPEENFFDPGIWTRSLGYFLDHGETIMSGGLHLPAEIPGAAAYNAATGPILSVLFSIGHLVGDLSGLIGSAGIAVCKAIPPCGAGLTKVSDLFGNFMSFLAMNFIPNIMGHINGGRLYDLAFAGDDVAENTSCQIEMGCRHLTNKEVATIRSEQLTEQKQEFDSQPLFARMFSTATPYSFISQLAVDMPTSVSGVSVTGLSSMLSSPLTRLGSVFSSLFASNRAFAAPATPFNDPFTLQYGYSDTDEANIGLDHEAFFNANCMNGPLATYDDTTNTVAIDPTWQDAHTTQDPNTELPVTDAVNPCPRILTGLQSLGGFLDPSVLPAGSTNSDVGSSTSDTTTTPTSTGSGTGSTSLPAGTAQELAKQIASSANISFQTDQDKSYFQQIIDTGRQTSCGGVAISPKLLGVILNLSERYKLVLGVFDDGHACNNGYHPKGMAVDLNGITDLADGKTTGNHIHWASSEQPLVKKFYIDAANVLAANGGGALGQIECFNAVSPPSPVTGVQFNTDTCDHLHMDVRGS
ncbi:MAG TPA: hypothetical protein VLF69_05925 [Candidatus Saccharimonadales bacterium]|nr:hypothetical protein [Candidatus Saccharimonadales bacterium]